MEIQKISMASYFTVVRLIGPAKYEHQEYPSLEAARAAKQEMGRDEYGRGGMIYAVTPQNETIFVE